MADGPKMKLKGKSLQIQNEEQYIACSSATVYFQVFAYSLKHIMG